MAWEPDLRGRLRTELVRIRAEIQELLMRREGADVLSQQERIHLQRLRFAEREMLANMRWHSKWHMLQREGTTTANTVPQGVRTRVP